MIGKRVMAGVEDDCENRKKCSKPESGYTISDELLMVINL
jgi:hypothetical protein